MADSQIIPLDIEEGLYRYTRTLWRAAGVDNFTVPPNQNPDSFMQLTNIRPPIDGVLRRRFGYATFVPSLDTGLIPGGDQISNAALYGAVFNGVNGYGDTLNSKTLPLNSTFSIEFWFETNSTNGGYFVSFNADKDPTGGDTQYAGVYMLPNGTIGAGLATSGGVTLSTATSASYNDGTGHHVVAVYTSTHILLYVDGVLRTTTPYTPTGAVPGYWRLANGAGGAGWPSISSYMGTFLSHVSVWSIALSAAQVTAHYQALFANNGTQSFYETVVSADSPVFFWYLNETTAAVPPLRGTIVQKVASTVATAGGTVSFPNPVAKGNVIVLCVSTQTPAQSPTVSDSLGNTYTAINSVPNNAGYGMFNYFAPITTAGPCVITVAATTPKQTSIIALELHNAIAGVDGSATAFSSSGAVVFASPHITTASSPDLVFSVAYANSIAAPTPGSGSTLLASTSGPSTNGTASHTANFLGLSFQSANTPATYGASWTQTGSHLWIAATFGITLTTPAVSPGTTFYDYADANNGGYKTATTSPNSSGYDNYSGSPVTFTATGPGIGTGDTGIIWVVMPPGVTLASITDSVGSTWSSVHAPVTGPGTHTYQPWTASMGGTVASGNPLTVTPTFVGGSFAVIGFVNVPGLFPLAQQALGDGTVVGTTFSSGGLTTADNEFFISLVTTTDGCTLPAGFTYIAGSTNGDDMGAAYDITSGILNDVYTAATNGDTFVDFLLSFPVSGQGFSLGEFIIIN